MHLETLLYMLLQSEKAVPPPGPLPDFEVLARKARLDAVPNQWIPISARKITLGMVDPDKEADSQRYFGWDNEIPARVVQVPAFEAKARAITIGDYCNYLTATRKESLPASWTHHFSKHIAKELSGKDEVTINGGPAVLTDAFLRGKAVRTVYGPVSLNLALDWPVVASYDEIAGCAAWMGGRIPTLEEARSIYSYVDEFKAKAKDPSKVLNGTIPAVNGCVIEDSAVNSR